MKSMRIAAAALALAAAGGTAAAQGYDGYDPDEPRWIESEPGGQYLLLSDTPLFRHDRLSRQKGYFDHGATDGRRFDYDRGYPYDWFNYGAEAEAEPEPPRRMRCETEWVRGRGEREDVPVQVCRG
jgi:hypothetical protein